jgi:hypothetical protein
MWTNDAGKEIFNSISDYECSWVSLWIFELAVTVCWIKATYVHRVPHEQCCFTTPLIAWINAEITKSKSQTFWLDLLYVQIHSVELWMEAYICSVDDSYSHRKDLTWYLHHPIKNCIWLEDYHHNEFYTQNGCVPHAIHSIWSIFGQAATVIASFRDPCVDWLISSGSNYWSEIVTEEHILPSYQFLTIIEWVCSLLGNLPVHWITLMFSGAWGMSLDKICTMQQCRII